jgi:hypothetical protein
LVVAITRRRSLAVCRRLAILLGVLLGVLLRVLLGVLLASTVLVSVVRLVHGQFIIIMFLQ